MSRTVFEKRWRGNPDSTIAKTDENKYLAVIADTGTASDDTSIPVALTTTASLVPVGQLLTYTDALTGVLLNQVIAFYKQALRMLHLKTAWAY